MNNSDVRVPPGHTRFPINNDRAVLYLEDSWRQHHFQTYCHEALFLVVPQDHRDLCAYVDYVPPDDWNVRKLPRVFADDGLCIFCELAQCENVRFEEIRQILLLGDNQAEQRQRLLQLLYRKGGMPCCVKPAKY